MSFNFINLIIDPKLLELGANAVEKQFKEAEIAKNDFEEAKLKALCFDRKFENPLSTPSKSNKSHQWYKSEDLAHADEVNAIGFGKKKNFDYERGLKKPTIHNYSIIGDILRTGMDSQPNSNSAKYYQTENNNQLPPIRARSSFNAESVDPILYEPRNLNNSKNKPKTRVINGVEIPLNIIHQFGTRVCEDLLKHEDKVNDLLDKYDSARKHKSRFITRKDVCQPKNPHNLEPSYESLGQAVRYNTFPGYSRDQNVSEKEKHYNWQVFENRTKIPDEFRAQKDELSKSLFFLFIYCSSFWMCKLIIKHTFFQGKLYK